MNTRLDEHIIKTDILIVGAGVGGMMAAIGAADSGAEVTICEKSNARRSGGLAGGNDHFYVYIPHIHGERIKENAVRAGIARGMIEEEIVRIHLDRTYEVLQKWESWGADMKIDGHYEFTGHGWPGSSGKMGEPGKTDRMYLHYFDHELIVKIEKQARDRGVQILNRVMITELLKDEDTHRVVGAVGISTREHRFYIIQAKSVVLNKSMFARIFPPSTLVGHGMANPGTNDQAIMAYRIGAEVHGAEFTGCMGALRFGPGSGRGTWVGVLRDNEGNPVAPPYLTKPDHEIGDVSVENGEAIDNVWKMGRGPVWMDCREISEADEEYMRKGLTTEANLALLNWIDQEGIDIRKTRFEFAAGWPGGGGIQVCSNARSETNIDGLYSIRSGLNSVSAVWGMVSGEEAAKFVTNVKHTNINDYQAEINRFKQGYDEILNREGTEYADWREVQWAIFQTMFSYAMPPLRTQDTLMTGYRQLIKLRDKTRNILQAGNPHELYHCVEVLNQIDIAELVLLAVMERKESRGQARRLDYPSMDPRLNNKFLVITQKDGKPFLRYEQPGKKNQ